MQNKYKYLMAAIVIVVGFFVVKSFFYKEFEVESYIAGIEKTDEFFTGISFLSLLEFRINDSIKFQVGNDELPLKKILDGCKSTICDLKELTGIESLTGVKVFRGVQNNKGERRPYTVGGAPQYKKMLDSAVGNSSAYQKPPGFCYRIYQVGIGYDSFNEFIADDDKETTEPKVLSANAIRARAYVRSNQGIEEGEVIASCDSFDEMTNYNNSDSKRRDSGRRDFIKDLMKLDGIWGMHVNHANQVKESYGLAWSTVEIIPNAYAEDEINNNDSEAKQASGGYLASLKVTTSSVLGGKKDKKWYFPWSNSHYYIRKDISETFFGTEISKSIISGESTGIINWFSSKPTRTIILSDPHKIARNRYIHSLVVTDGFKWKDFRKGEMIKSNGIEEAVEKSIDELLEENSDFITDISKKYLRSILMIHMKNKYPDEQIVFRFK